MKKTTRGPLVRGLFCAVLLLAGGGPLMAANPPTDFQYGLNLARDGVVIKKYLGKTPEVVIPGMIDGFAVTEIETGAFKHTDVEIVSVVIPEWVFSINEEAFAGQGKLKQVTFPRNLRVIRGSAFYNCDQLAGLVIPDGVWSIGSLAFSNCTALTTVTIPGSVTSIGDRAFSGCTALATVRISEGVTSIGDRAFSNCTALTTVTIPGSVTSIGDHAFSGCTRLSLAVRKQIQDCGYTGEF
ncbi:MAG: leucine-rich repeat domain-containing protein [Spirochaetaceae bacterium]|jgi:hypothetical protein|nr:leucine-rich repeat domain-containing protein [Spirochaetaceae bacterium]